MKTSLLQRLPLRDAAWLRLHESPDGSHVFPGGALSSPAAVERRRETLKAWGGDRAALQAWLADQNAFAPLQAAQKAHLEASGRTDSVFLLTGQQPGLLGGPALWYAKAMSCAAWARKLSGRLGRPVIPVFWVAGDDSDLAECNAVEWLEPSAPSASLSLEFPEPLAPIPMSLRRLSREGARQLADVSAGWSPDVAALAACYRPGRSVTEGFLHLAQSFLAEEGLLFVDGFSAAAMAQPLLQRLAASAPAFERVLGSGSRRTQESGLGLQVSMRHGAAPVFLLEGDQRLRLFFSETEPTRLYVQGNEARNLLPQLPGCRLLHSALSRPLVAEQLFPVLGHVLGPAELRYFAQLAEVFPAFGFTAPPLAARQQSLACSRPDWERLSALGITVEELPQLGPSRLRARLTRQAWEASPASREFPEGAFLDFAAALRRYQESQFPGSNLDPGMRRLERAFERYREGARQALFAREAGETYASFRPLLRWLGNGSQDRHLNLLSLRNLLGADGFAAFSASLRTEEESIAVSLYAGNS